MIKQRQYCKHICLQTQTQKHMKNILDTLLKKCHQYHYTKQRPQRQRLLLWQQGLSRPANNPKLRCDSLTKLCLTQK